MTKRLFSIILTLIILGIGSVAAQEYKIDDKAADIHATVDKRLHDFGNLHQSDDEARCTFTITNEGSAPLVIISATASCGCTRPHFTSKPIQPGESGTVDVTYRPAGNRGEIDQNVKVRLRSASKPAKSKRIMLKIAGTVLPD